MLFPRFVLIPVECEHDRLEERVDLTERNKSTERGDVAWFGLEEEEEIRILLKLQCR